MSDFGEIRKLTRDLEGEGASRVLCALVRKLSFMLLGHRVRLLELEARIDVLEKVK